MILHKSRHVKLWDWIIDAFFALKSLATMYWDHENVPNDEWIAVLSWLEQSLMKLAASFFHEEVKAAHTEIRDFQSRRDISPERSVRGHQDYFGRIGNEVYQILGLGSCLKYEVS